MNYELTLADQKAAATAARSATGASGRHAYLKDLSRHPLAQDQLPRVLRGFDHVYLTQIDGTDLVVWTGRKSDGYFHDIGKFMRLIPLAKAEQTKEK